MVKEQIFQDLDKSFADFFTKDHSAEVKEEDRQQYLEKLYGKVVKNFSEIKEDEIKIEYCPHVSYDMGIQIINPIIKIQEGKLIKEPVIYAGKTFFCFSREEQEATVAHEIGHYMNDKDKKLIVIDYSSMLHDKLDDWGKSRIHLGKRKVKKLKDFYERGEISADNWAAKKDYAQGLLKFFKTRCPANKLAISRIANLEGKLKSA